MRIRERTLLEWMVQGAVGTAPEPPQPLCLCLSCCLPPHPHPHPQPPGQWGLESPGHRLQSHQPESLPARPGGSGPRALSLPACLTVVVKPTCHRIRLPKLSAQLRSSRHMCTDVQHHRRHLRNLPSSQTGALSP